MEDDTPNPEMRARLRELPSIDQLADSSGMRALLEGHPRARSVAALRLAVQAARERISRGDERGFDPSDVQHALEKLSAPKLRRVFNATGVVLHTNLGRAPLAEAAAARVAEVATHYCNLEYDLETGSRGSRYAPLLESLRALTGAESAVVVNNGAAAVLLALSALASGKEVIVSRGELVEIGGGFRIPEVMAQSGARLVEVGTTNRTRLADYERAIGPQTALLVKVHQSNFAQVGFTEEASVGELATLGRRKGIPLFCDLGSGNFAHRPDGGLWTEPEVRSVVEDGASLVAFSGDKLLGGPQAGILVGEEARIAAVRAHPLNRALRVGKLTVAALEATLALYQEDRADEIPAVGLLRQSPERLRARADQLASLLHARDVASEVEVVEGRIGGGAMPLAAPASFACTVRTGPEAVDRLRQAAPPLIARMSQGRLVLDVRTLRDEDLTEVADAVATRLSSRPC